MFLLYRQAWGLSGLGVSVHPHTFMCPPVCLDVPCMSDAPTHLYVPHAPLYNCMFLGVSAYDVGMGGIYTPHIECLDDDMLELSIFT